MPRIVRHLAQYCASLRMEIAVKASDDFHQLLKGQEADCLSLLNSSYGTSACAASAVDALIGIDLELSVAHADSTNGAVSLACTACNTFITYNICHDIFLLLINNSSSLPKKYDIVVIFLIQVKPSEVAPNFG